MPLGLSAAPAKGLMQSILVQIIQQSHSESDSSIRLEVLTVIHNIFSINNVLPVLTNIDQH
jgi:hypothetical protein